MTWQDRKVVTLPPVIHPAPEQRLQLEPNSKFYAELMPADEVPTDCACPVMPCSGTAVVWVTADSGYARKPLCLAHCHYAFAEWMCGI